jgi:hypothetical protein
MKSCRDIIHASFDAELNTDSESAQPIARQDFRREKILKKRSKD